MIEVVERPCEVCEEDVLMQADSKEPALCIVHYFTDDPTEAWEADGW